MSTSATKLRGASWLLIVGSLGSFLHAGCKSPSAPPQPPGGGQTLMLSFAEFDSLVEPILMSKGCDSVSGGDCHGGGIQGTFQLSPPGAKNAQFDFDQVSVQVSVSNRSNSPILTKPLAVAAGGSLHNGPKPFATTADADYQAILQWINHGVIQ